MVYTKALIMISAYDKSCDLSCLSKQNFSHKISNLYVI